MEEKYNNIILSLGISTKSVNLKSRYSPISKPIPLILYSTQLLYSQTVWQQRFINIENVKLEDELFRIFSSDETTILHYDQSETKFFSRSQGLIPLFRSTFTLSNTEVNTERKVYNVLDMIGDIGGVLEFTQIFVMLFVKICTSNLYQRSTIHQYSTKMASRFSEESHFNDQAKTKANLNIGQPGRNSLGGKKFEMISAKINKTQNDIKNRELVFQMMNENKYK